MKEQMSDDEIYFFRIVIFILTLKLIYNHM